MTIYLANVFIIENSMIKMAIAFIICIAIVTALYTVYYKTRIVFLYKWKNIKYCRILLKVEM